MLLGSGKEVKITVFFDDLGVYMRYCDWSASNDDRWVCKYCANSQVQVYVLGDRQIRYKIIIHLWTPCNWPWHIVTVDPFYMLASIKTVDKLIIIDISMNAPFTILHTPVWQTTGYSFLKITLGIKSERKRVVHLSSHTGLSWVSIIHVYIYGYSFQALLRTWVTV